MPCSSKLAAAEWSRSILDHHAVAELMKADWPLLRCLKLDISAACPDVYSLLRLLFDNADTQCERSLVLPRQINADLPANMVTWPRLHRVHFGFGVKYV